MKKQTFIFSTILALLLTGMFLTLTTKEVKAATETIFEQDFEACNLVSGSDNVYQASGGFAGASNGLSIVENGISGKSVKVAHEFWPKADGGWQKEAFYKDNLTMASADAYYGIYFEVEVFGNIDFIYFKGAKGIDGAQIEYNVSAGTITAQGDAGLSADYAKEGNVYKIQMSWQGNGGNSKVFFFTNVHSTDPEGDAGYYLIDNFKFLSSDSPIDELDNHIERVVYEQDFTGVDTSVVGSNAMYAATGFAGAANGLSIAEDGINGKSLKVVHAFWPVNPDGGWQKETMYQTVRLAGTVSTKLYELSTDIKLFGSVGQADFKLLFNDVSKGSVTLRPNGTHQVNTLESDKSIVKDILVSYDSTKQVFHLDYVFNGADGNLMFINYMNTTSDEGETGFYLDNFKLVKILPRTAKEKVQGTYEDIFSQNFDSLTAGTTYATGGEMYQAISFAGPNDSGKEIREIIADGIHNNSLKITYDFFDNNCSMGSVYLDWNKAVGAASEVYTIYKFEVNIKTFGNVDIEIYKNMGNWIGINLATGATWGPAGVDNFIYSESTLENGVYHYTAYLYGNGGPLTDTFEVHIVPDTTDPTGLIIDDYKISRRVSLDTPEEPVDVKPTITSASYDLGTNTDVVFNVDLKGQELTEVKIGDKVLTNEEYALGENKLTVKYQVLNALNPGKYTVEIITTESASSELTITNINVQITGNYTDKYAEDFEALELKTYTGDELYHEDGFAGVNSEVIENGIDGKSLKVIYNFYTFADGGWQNGCLYLDSSKSQAPDTNTVYRISFTIKPFGNYGMVAFGIQFDNAASNPNAIIYLKSDGTYSSDPNNLLIKYDVEYDDGEFMVTAYYKSAGYYLFNYWHMNRLDDETPTGFMLDDYSFAVVGTPKAVSNSAQLYDIVTMELPSYELDLAGFEVLNVMAGEALLVKDTDYTLTTLDNGNAKLTLTKAYMDTKAVGDTINLTVNTTKLTAIALTASVVNAVPVISENNIVYQLDSNTNVVLTVDLKDVAISSIKVAGRTLEASEYSLAGNKLTINAAVFEALEVGAYKILVTTGDTATVDFTVSDADRVIAGTYTPIYSQDFEGIAVGTYTSDTLYRNCGFAGVSNAEPGAHQIVEGKYLKSTYDFFTVAQGGWQKEMLYLNSGYTEARNTALIYRTTFDVSAFGAWSEICYGVQLADSGIPNNWLHLFNDGTYRNENYNDYFVKTEVTYENGTFHVVAYYRSAGNYIFSFWNLQRNDDNVETGLLLDNFQFAKMNVPELVSDNGTYDVAVNNHPYYLVDLFEYEATSVKIGETALVKGTDYTAEAVFESTRIRFELTEAFVKKYQVGTDETIVITTSKGNTIELSFKVVDTTPAVTDETSVDKAEATGAQITIDLKGESIEKISLNGEDLAGNEYTVNAASTTLTFKAEYVAKLAEGENVFTLTSTSGATKTFKLVVSDTTPTLANGTYQKGSTAGVELTLDLKGKEVTSVTLDGTPLTASDYTIAGGKLTIASSVLESLTVGEHTVVLKTLGQATAKITVADVNPEITGEYTITSGDALVVLINLHDRAITSVKLDDFVLAANEYSYADGELTILASVIEELSASTHTLVVETAGGSVQASFTVQAKTNPNPDTTTTSKQDETPTSSDKQDGSTTKKIGCFSSVGITLIPLFITSICALYAVRKRREE